MRRAQIVRPVGHERVRSVLWAAGVFISVGGGQSWGCRRNRIGLYTPPTHTTVRWLQRCAYSLTCEARQVYMYFPLCVRDRVYTSRP